MNIRHEFTRALTVAFRDDVYYGYAWETNDSYTFQQLDQDYCKISSIEDGVYNFAFNFSYFDANSERLTEFPAGIHDDVQCIRKRLQLEMAGIEQRQYRLYTKLRADAYSDSAVCEPVQRIGRY